MAFADQAALAVNSAFRDKVRVAAVIAALQVQGEDASTYSEQQYQKRQKLAGRVLANGGTGTLEQFAWAVAANAAIDSSSSDGDIQFTVNSVWDDLAGVDAGD